MRIGCSTSNGPPRSMDVTPDKNSNSMLVVQEALLVPHTSLCSQGRIFFDSISHFDVRKNYEFLFQVITGEREDYKRMVDYYIHKNRTFRSCYINDDVMMGYSFFKIATGDVHMPRSKKPKEISKRRDHENPQSSVHGCPHNPRNSVSMRYEVTPTMLQVCVSF